MPTYEYKCCGVSKSITQSIKDKLIAPICMVCNSEMPRVYEATAAVFKGTGWGKDVSSKR